MPSRVVLVVLVLVLAGLGGAGGRVYQLERFERTSEVSFTPTQTEAASIDGESDGATLSLADWSGPFPGEMELSLSVCSDWAPIELLGPVEMRRMAGDEEDGGGRSSPDDPPSRTETWDELPLSPALESIGIHEQCLGFVHRGGDLTGEIELHWAPGAFGTLGDRSLAAELVARPALGRIDWTIFGVLLLAAGFLVGAGQRISPDPFGWSVRQALVPLGVFLLFPILLQVGGQSSTGLFVNTALTIAAYVGTMVAIMGRSRFDRLLAALSFHRVSVGQWGFAAAVGLLLALAAYLSIPLYSAGESDMTQLVQLSSGVMSLAALGLVSVWAEEFLLRGVIYGACQNRWGHVVAVLGSAGVFSALHLAQHWGNLSAWVVVSATGLALSLVRWTTGSSLASTVSHLVYNLALIVPSLILAS